MDHATYDANGSFYVYETIGVDRRQAVFIYLWLLGFFAPLMIWGALEDAIRKMPVDDDLVASLFLAIWGAVLILPYLLRRWVKRRNLQRWRRQALGLHN
ncbi:MAG TPA: hypothetical protein VKU01_19425 [Bryobacteraceae bacterium]|nr:hypothetical protein [Bryobacteraceae bacterium]